MAFSIDFEGISRRNTPLLLISVFAAACFLQPTAASPSRASVHRISSPARRVCFSKSTHFETHNLSLKKSLKLVENEKDAPTDFHCRDCQIASYVEAGPVQDFRTDRFFPPPQKFMVLRI